MVNFLREGSYFLFDLLVAELWADVTHVDILEWLMGLHITDLNNEGMRAVALPANNQLSHDNSMVCSPS
jgi:hypothetical protein